LPQSFTDLTLEHVIDPEHLIHVYYQLKSQGGHAPGPDGLIYRDLGRRDVCECMRQLSEIIEIGCYRPGPSRKLAIPKPGGGHRTLSIRNLFDRVVSAALNRTLGPLWEREFLDMSYGFRAQRGTWNLLADLMATMVSKQRFVIALDDVRKAFDNVRLADVLHDHRKYIKDGSLLNLIERVLRGGDDVNRTLGIHQGDPYSPTALNIRLHHVHDVPFTRKRRNPPAFRYADNVCYLCADVPEGVQVLEQARDLLEQSGLTLKGEDGPPIDLRIGGEAQLLGFSLSVRDDRPQVGLGTAAWSHLQANLNSAHDDPYPPEAARRVVEGWIESHGPAFEGDVVAAAARILQTAASQGFRELGSPILLERRIDVAHRRWCTYRKREYARRRVREATGLQVGAPPPTVGFGRAIISWATEAGAVRGKTPRAAPAIFFPAAFRVSPAPRQWRSTDDCVR
jgi:retron-type reverse transcriptase